MALESSIVDQILKLFRDTPRAYAEKIKGTSSAAGRADINAVYKGRLLRLEVKTPDHRNTASLRQNINLVRWHRAGAVTGVVYSVAAVKHILAVLDAEQKGQFEFCEDNGCVSRLFVPDPEAVYQGSGRYKEMEKGYLDELL